MNLSIITINYNNAEGLRKTLASVASQTFREFEHIIVDGGSTDGSVEIIKEYEETIHRTPCTRHLLWLSEKDNGIYDAMNKGVEIASGIRVVNALNRSELVEDKNKGVRKATGEYVYFLNSGDALASNEVLEDIMHDLNGSDFVVGRVFFSLNEKRVSTSPLLTEKDMSLYYMYLHGINHQSAFIKRKLLIQTPYDTSVKMGADWKFFVQSIVLDNASVQFIDKTIADFDLSGVSSDSKAIKQERAKILSTFIPERVARDYLAIAPHYYEVVRVGWLLEHPFWYKLYRGLTTFGRKNCNL